jgi:two-component system OmpR family sensor kinase
VTRPRLPRSATARLGRPGPRRLRLWALVALVLGLATGVPAALLADRLADDVRDMRDERLGRLAIETTFSLQESEDRPGEIDLDSYAASGRPANGDATAVVDRRGGLLAGDVVPPLATRRIAAARARAGDEAPITLAGTREPIRLVAIAVAGEEEQIGALLAFAPASIADDEAGAVVRRVALLALAGWALLTVLLVVAVSRALRPTDASARATGAFLADAAHELRTPWAIVRGQAERGLRGADPAADLRVIADTAATAGTTIADMLELARLDSGRGLGERERLRLDALASACADERAEQATAAAVELRVDAPDAVIVTGDERLLARAVGNLIDNALRHGGAGGSIDVRVRRESDVARLEVADTGPGIAPGQRERIFDRFHRGSAAAAGGSGLGLPIARMVAEAHGGGLAVVEREDAGPGARFVLTLPAG